MTNKTVDPLSLGTPAPRLVSAFTTLALLFALTSSARAGLQVPPLTLPAPPTTPHLWFDGADPAQLTALKARVSHPRTVGFFNAFKSYVDQRLGTIDAADDDTCSKLVKAAALLHVLGQTPPNTFATYRDVAVAAFSGVGTREAVDSLLELSFPPADAINVLQDSSRLQSLAEGYDMLRGSGLSDEALKKMQDVLADWAEALRNDWNLTGAIGISGHRDNWGIKGGSALITTALALPEHPSAASWLASGMTFLNESLDVVASTTGWFSESVWYLNYSLANLWPTAWHVDNAAGVDWHAALRPFVTASLAWRQPDGSAPPFEEGLANTLPWNAMASAYPDLAPTMLWAWEQSPKITENFENQQLHDVTRFILADLSSVAVPPSGPITRTLPPDARLVALRSGWDASALQVTSITARDHATSELIQSRHNMRNPLDLVLHHHQVLAVPTASGGPQVTSSANRATYLSVLAKNIPLVNRGAPFIVDASNVTFTDRLDSEDEGARANHFADLARTTLTQVYFDTREVTRIVAMIDHAYVVVLDRFASTFAKSFEVSWRGRGARTTRSDTASLKGYSWAGVAPQGVAPHRLDLDVVGTGALSAADNASLYAPAWNQEEKIDGVLVGRNASTAAFISVLQVHPSNTQGRAVTAHGSGQNAVATITSGLVQDTALMSNGGDLAGEGVSGQGLAAIVRREGGVLTGLALVQVTRLEVGALLVESSAPVTLALTPGTGAFVAELSADRATPVALVLDGLPGLDPTRPHRAFLEGVPITAGFSQSGARLSFSALGTGTLVVEALPCLSGSGPDPDGDLYCGVADNCPSVANPNQLDSDGDGVGDVCECLDAATRCDDANPCTSDSCTATTGACAHAPVGGNPSCDDGDLCTTADRCQGGQCLGDPRDCDDDLVCTADTCDPELGCQHTARDGQSCDDGDLCTSDDRCQGASCAGVLVACDDGNPCTQEACSSTTGCVVTGLLDGGGCDDGDACTGGDLCVGAECTGEPIACDDDDPCTADSCSPATGCVHTPLGPEVVCDDGLRCTEDDRCAAGLCGGSPLSCDDGNPCTTDRCDPTLGCVSTALADDLSCDDGNACTTADRCRAGACVGDGLVCDDGDPCTVDGCELGLGCTSRVADDGTPCDDGDRCSDGDRCEDGVCVGDPVDCDDDDPCTVDRCDAEGDGACLNEPLACPDDMVCVDGACALIVVEPEPGPELVEPPPVEDELEPGPEADGDPGELGPEPAPEPDPEADPEPTADTTTPDPDPPDAPDATDTSDATQDDDGLELGPSDVQKIAGDDDDGCAGGGLDAIAPLSLILLAALRSRRARRLPR